ncbi:MAG: HYR domain-containing protein [Planctomycetota bacterium]|jgi:hypothetical protein
MDGKKFLAALVCLGIAPGAFGQSLSLVQDQACYNTGVGATVNVDVNLTYSTGVAADFIVSGQFLLTYNTASFNNPSISVVGGSVFDTILFQNINTGTGEISFAVSDGAGGQEPGTGSNATMARITFDVLDAEVCESDLELVWATGSPQTQLVQFDFDVVVPTTTDMLDYIADETLPVITGCPTNITVDNVVGTCTNTASWTVPGTSDNCPEFGSFTATHFPDSSLFPVGTTTVTYTLTDNCGNVGALCQFDVTVNETNLCGDAGTECVIEDTCSGAVCVDNGFVANGTSCGDPTNTTCNGADTCDGAGNCQLNFAAEFTACGDPSDTDCTNPDSCDAAGSCLDRHEAEFTACGDPSDTDCTNPDTCDPFGSCLSRHEAEFTACGDPLDDDCTNPDTCDPFGSCLPRDEAFMTACGDPTVTECSLGDICDGGGICLPNDVAAGTPCGDATNNTCTNPDDCDGGGQCLDNHAPDTTACDDATACTVSDECLTGVCVGDPLDTIDVTVELEGVLQVDGTRCITFELWDAAPCDGSPQAPSVVQTVAMSFADNLGNFTATTTLSVPCGVYGCITARAELHTLRRTVSPVDAGGFYTADFTGVGSSLPIMNLNDDLFIDIIDFAVFNSVAFGAVAAPADCVDVDLDFPNVDATGDGNATNDEFVNLLNHFFDTSDANCCSQPNATAADGPVAAISVEDLISMGQEELTVADLNNDGMVDMDDVAAYANGERPDHSRKARRGGRNSLGRSRLGSE